MKNNLQNFSVDMVKALLYYDQDAWHITCTSRTIRADIFCIDYLDRYGNSKSFNYKER